MFYPYPANGLVLWQVVAALVLLLAVSVSAAVLWRKRPWILVGWLWYLIMLVPVIGLIQSGLRARADRYTYLPQIGLYILVTWLVVERCSGWRHRRLILGGGAVIIVWVLTWCARVQTAYWQNNELLWTHTLACTSDNVVAHNNLGTALIENGNLNDAITHFQKALRINPDDAEAHNNLGGALLQKGQVDEAIAQIRMALQSAPNSPIVHNNLGGALLQKGQVDEAIAHVREALQIQPDNAIYHYNLGRALFKKGNVDEAIAQYQEMLQIEPGYAQAQHSLNDALLLKGKIDKSAPWVPNSVAESA